MQVMQVGTVLDLHVDLHAAEKTNQEVDHGSFEYAMQERTVPTCVATPVDPSPEEVSLLREHFSGIASMSADDFALRNSTVHMQNSPKVLSFSNIVKRIAMQRV